MGLILSMAFFFIFVTLIFVAIAIFLPEWMGITGKHAKRIMEEQRGDYKEEPPAPSDNGTETHSESKKD